MANLKQALKKHSKRLLTQYKKAGLVGVGISKKKIKGKTTDKLALTLYVEKKLDASSIAPENRVDLDATLLADVFPTEIDVKEIGHIKAFATGRVRPVQTGCSEGHYKITAGTGSVLVTKQTTGKVLRLSNNHVYANTNDAKIGDPIYQPGPYDRGTSADTVGVLEEFFPLDFVNSNNKLDAALRTTSADELQLVFGLNTLPSQTVVAVEGMQVVKSGRTTNVTRGTITDVNLSVRVDYDRESDVIYEDQILIESDESFSQGGDSGSAVFTDNGASWVGLLFAGSDTTTICNHAVDVERLLNVKLYIADGTPPPPPPQPPPPTKSFPWWAVIGGVIVVAIVIYLIVR